MLRNLKSMEGFALGATDGEIGKVREVYFDDQQWLVRYLLVETGSWLFGRWVLIPPQALEGVDGQACTIRTSLSQEQVRMAPDFDADKPVSLQHQHALQQHYGWNLYPVVPGSFAATLPLGRSVPGPGSRFQDGVEETPSASEDDPHLRSSRAITGYAIHAQDEGDAGEVVSIIVNDTDWNVRYLVIRGGRLLHRKTTLLAPQWVEQISYGGREIFVNLLEAAIHAAPQYDASTAIDRSYEQRLHEHYDRPAYWEAVEAARAR